MGVYIKGMEMPPNCCQCPVNMEVCKRGYEYLLKHSELYDKRADDCPLVPVTEHGRLGDLDALAKIVLNWITTQEKAYPNEDSNALSWRLGARAMGHQIYRDIEAAPTIIPAEQEEEKRNE